MEDEPCACDPVLLFPVDEIAFDASMAKLKRINKEFGVRRILLDFPVSKVEFQMDGATTDNAYDRFERLALRVKTALVDTDIEVGYVKRLTLPDLQDDDSMIRHVKRFAEAIGPWMILFEGASVVQRRNGGVAPMGDALRELGYELRQSVDKVSPKTRMGLCVEADFERDGEAVIDFARAIAGGGRPFVCYATALRGAKARTNSSLDCPVGLALWGYRWLPPDFEICYEFGFEPRSSRSPVCRMDEAMHILHVALGTNDLFLRVSNAE